MIRAGGIESPSSSRTRFTAASTNPIHKSNQIDRVDASADSLVKFLIFLLVPLKMIWSGGTDTQRFEELAAAVHFKCRFRIAAGFQHCHIRVRL